MKKIIIILILLVFVGFVGVAGYNSRKNYEIQQAYVAYDNGRYDEAQQTFTKQGMQEEVDHCVLAKAVKGTLKERGMVLDGITINDTDDTILVKIVGKAADLDRTNVAYMLNGYHVTLNGSMNGEEYSKTYNVTQITTSDETLTKDNYQTYVKTVISNSSTSSSGNKEKVTCTMCNGTGSVKSYYGSSDLEAVLSGHDPYTFIKCSTCDGKGYKYTNVSGNKTSNSEICGSCNKYVSRLKKDKDAAGVTRNWCSDCWSSYWAIMG